MRKNYIAIHPVIDIPGQNRQKNTELQSDSKRISDGCINLTLDDYKTAADFTLRYWFLKQWEYPGLPICWFSLKTTKLAEFPWPSCPIKDPINLIFIDIINYLFYKGSCKNLIPSLMKHFTKAALDHVCCRLLDRYTHLDTHAA